MKLFCFINLVLLLLVSQFVQAQTPSAAAPPQIGEKLTYNISFANFTDAGFAELQTIGRERIGDREVVRIRAKVKTTGAVEATLLSLDNEYNCLIAPENGLPVRVERNVRDVLTASETRRDFAENLAATNENGVFDLISAIYRVRSLPLTNGAVYPIKIWDNEQIYDAELRVAGRETISTTVGAFNAFVIQVRVLNNDEFKNYRMQILLSDDERHLPVAIRVKHPKGMIRAELASVQILFPEVAVVEPQPTPIGIPTPRPAATPRPTPVPRQYVENQPLSADLPFALGEKLQYDVSRNNQKAAAVLLEIKERKQFSGRDTVLLSATVKQIIGGGILTPGDSISSYIEPESLVPVRSEIRLGGALAAFNQTLNFNQELGAVTTDKNLSAEIPVGTYDLLSLVYALRAFRFDVNNALQNPNAPPDPTKTRDTKAAAFLGQTPRIVNLRPLQIETIELGGRKIKAVALGITTGDPQIDQLNLRIWLSDDVRRLPLRLNANTSLGTIQADLTNYTPAK